MKRKVAIIIIVMLILSLLLLGCADTTKDVPEKTDAAGKTTEPTETIQEPQETEPEVPVPDFDSIDFPDMLPTGAIMADNSKYAYDDLTEHYDLSIVHNSWGGEIVPREQDPIWQWLENKFNLTIDWDPVPDVETTLSTRFASGDQPDMFYATEEISFAATLYESGQLIDCRTVYPYLPQMSMYTTSYMIKAIQREDGALPAITHYAIQDGVWGFAVRSDWLETFGMQEPSSEEALLEYARACTFDDPDGNGEDDTYFMISACDGQSVTSGMFDGFSTMFGNPAVYLDDGSLSHPMFNGTRIKVLQFLNKLYANEYIHPDWYTIDWGKGFAYIINDKIGCVWCPAGAMLSIYHDSNEATTEAIEQSTWVWYHDVPIEGGKYPATGDYGYLWCFSKSGFESEGKLKRVAHMMDSMVIGGDNYFPTIQCGTSEVFEAAGIATETERKMVYNDDGTFTIIGDSTGWPWNDTTLMAALSLWQPFGLNVTYNMTDESSGTDYDKSLAKWANTFNKIIINYDRWPNDGLLSDVAQETIAPGITDFVNSEELKFVMGARPFDEWDAYTQEWLDKGGKDIIAAQAAKLGVDLPEYAN